MDDLRFFVCLVFVAANRLRGLAGLARSLLVTTQSVPVVAAVPAGVSVGIGTFRDVAVAAVAGGGGGAGAVGVFKQLFFQVVAPGLQLFLVSHRSVELRA